MNKLEKLIENYIEYFRPGYILTDRERKKVMEGLKITCEENTDSEPITNTEPVRHGEWIVDKQSGEYARCSLCNGTTGTQWDGVEPIPLLTAYCPHCGACMQNFNYIEG